jgi:uncharacterized protein
MDTYERTPQTNISRLADRGRYDRESVDAILDDALICHVGIARDDGPVVIPTIHARLDDVLYVHGSPLSGWLRLLRAGAPVCVTATVVDGLVLARSVFHHSLNYRSVVVFGTATEVADRAEKIAASKALADHVLPGRWAETRQPSAKELAATLILRIALTNASAKVRTGPPIDDADDLTLEHWAGVVPLNTVAVEPIADPTLHAGIAVPPSVTDPRGRWTRGS